MEASATAARRKRGKTDTSHRDKVGSWPELCLAEDYGQDEKYSVYDLLLRRQFQNAMEGKGRAVEFMMRAVSANLKLREEEESHLRKMEARADADVPKNPRNADMAMLILGICAVDDETLSNLGPSDGPGYLTKLKVLRPTHVEDWVVDLAVNRAGAPKLSQWERDIIARHTVSPKSPEVRRWRRGKGTLIEHLMRVRGPGATQFPAGTSGNPRGRPRKEPPIEFPYDGFLMEPITLRIGNREQTVTRLDALMLRLTRVAAEGNQKIADVILPKLMRIYEHRWWEERVPEIEIIRG